MLPVDECWELEPRRVVTLCYHCPIHTGSYT